MTDRVPNTSYAVTAAVSRFRSSPFAAIWVATGLLFVLSTVVAPGSLTRSGLQAMLPFAGILAIASVGQTLIIQQGGLDLSLPGLFSLGAVLVTVIPGGEDVRLWVGLVVVVVAGVVAGLVNGLVVTRLRITSLVATLAMNALAVGAVLQVTGGSIAFRAPPAWTEVASAQVLGIPMLTILAVAFLAVTHVTLVRSVVGRRFQLVGANPAAARIAGVRVQLHEVSSYVIGGVSYVVAGALSAGYLGSTSLFSGDDYLLPAIAAVVLGGTTLGAGRGSVVATAGGVLFLAQTDQVIRSFGGPTSVDLIVQGSIVAIGMGLRNASWTRRARAPTALPPTAGGHGPAVGHRRDGRGCRPRSGHDARPQQDPHGDHAVQGGMK